MGSIMPTLSFSSICQILPLCRCQSSTYLPAIIIYIQLECFRWHFCDEINVALNIVNNTNKQTKKQTTISDAPRKGTKKETKSKWIYVAYTRINASREWFFPECFYCVCKGIQSSFFADAYFYGLYKIIYFVECGEIKMDASI